MLMINHISVLYGSASMMHVNSYAANRDQVSIDGFELNWLKQQKPLAIERIFERSNHRISYRKNGENSQNKYFV